MRPTRLILALCLLLSACQKHARVAALPPPPPPVPVAATPAPAPPPPDVPVVLPAPPPRLSPLIGADQAFNAGNYDEAARSYEEYLRVNTNGNERDQALFYLGLSYALRPGTGADWTKAGAAFKQLVDQHPQSPLKPPASLILSLHLELDQATNDGKTRDLKIKQLTTELDRLKKIDADRRKRP